VNKRVYGGQLAMLRFEGFGDVGGYSVEVRKIPVLEPRPIDTDLMLEKLV
jgi:hypothetical protein